MRIAVCGLNPHAGEAGLLGTEERDIIDPILDRLRPAYPGLSRTLPGDTVFGRQLKGEFDAILALYHDQGLAPLKAVDFDEAVNVTLGLPFVRTSPDHGTAFALAEARKRGETSRSFENAVAVARATDSKAKVGGESPETSKEVRFAALSERAVRLSHCATFAIEHLYLLNFALNSLPSE